MVRPRVSILDRNATYRKLRADLRRMDNSYTKVGFPNEKPVGQSTRSGSHPAARDMSEIAFIAAKNEFGVKNKQGGWKIPPRPAIRNALDNNRAPLNRLVMREYENVLAGIATVDVALSTIGEWLTNKIKSSITRLRVPPNARSTIAAKGSSNPLIDTGQMRNSVTHAEHMVGGKRAPNVFRSRLGKIRIMQG